MSVFINKGEPHLTPIQATNRGRRLFESQKPNYIRETGLVTGDQDYLEWANRWLSDNMVNAENNHFNFQLKEYRKALARLARYVLADGRNEVFEDQPTGELDDAGEPVTERNLIQDAINPLPATVRRVTYNDEGLVVVTMVNNPLIIADEAGRQEAQTVIDETPIEVRIF